MATKLYVGNLPFKAQEEELRALFEEQGAVESVSIIRDRFSGQSRGFGFVEMATAEDAQRAIEALNGHEMEGRPLTVNEARPQTGRTHEGRRDRPRQGGGRR